MLDRDESSDETARASTTTSSTQWIPSEIDWSKISERGKAIKLRIVDEMLDGYSLATIAQELGQTQSWVSDRLAELRREITLTHTSNHLYPLQPNDLEALKESIQEHGIQTPVLIGDHTIIDGRHRCLIAQELGIELPAVFVQGLTVDQEHEIALAVNTVRRQMSQKQKHELVRRELLANWNKSDRSLATSCGVSAPTIGRIRVELRREQEVQPTDTQVAHTAAQINQQLQPEIRVDRQGREFEVKPNAQAYETIAGHSVCPCCGGYLTIVKTLDGLGLRYDTDK
jgi:hypothetical protein